MQTEQRKDHWESTYTAKAHDRLGWYTPHLETSLDYIQEIGAAKDAPIIDVGGGASTLVDDLLQAGYTDVTVLDLSAEALAASRERLGEDAARVQWLEGDITTMELPSKSYRIWHDRAVFHFLTSEAEQQRYRATLAQELALGGHLVMGVFAPEAPPKCSGLPVQRYTVEALQQTLGTEFELERSHKEMHVTPGGVEQMYLYCRFRKVA